ncbi:MAG: hypothetical protein RI567_07940 [Marinobacter sp.]|nr:hypothetical protein [Marinobacter sp.]
MWWALGQGEDPQPEALTVATWGGSYEASLISCGPARKSAQKRVGLHTDVGVPMRPYMPTAPGHMDNAVVRDHRWYSQTVELREARFREWLEVGRLSSSALEQE